MNLSAITVVLLLWRKILPNFYKYYFYIFCNFIDGEIVSPDHRHSDEDSKSLQLWIFTGLLILLNVTATS